MFLVEGKGRGTHPYTQDINKFLKNEKKEKRKKTPYPETSKNKNEK